MKLNLIVGTALLVASSVVWAQFSQLQIKPLEVKPPVATQPATSSQAQPSQLQLNTEEAQLKRRIAELEHDNAELNKRVQAFTSLGGSNVHAYCPVGSPQLSRNTSGAEENCGFGGYLCDSVSGLCRSSCTISDHCSTGYDCDDGRCKTLGEIQRKNDPDA